jgi:hypothetical protein
VSTKKKLTEQTENRSGTQNTNKTTTVRDNDTNAEGVTEKPTDSNTNIKSTVVSGKVCCQEYHLYSNSIPILKPKHPFLCLGIDGG